MSNLASDISRAENLQTGDLATPYSDLMNAIMFAHSKATMYSQKADTSITTVRIALFTGDHFVVRKKYDYSLSKLCSLALFLTHFVYWLAYLSV